MKLIIVDFLRRWWGAYLLALAFVDPLTVVNLKLGLTFAGVLALPFGFEVSRGSIGVLRTLPVSRSTITSSFWCLAVCLPVLLMTASVASIGLLFPYSGISLCDVAIIFFGSLAYFPGLVGLCHIGSEYLWPETYLVSNAAKHTKHGQVACPSLERIPMPKPRMARFGGVYFDTVWKAFLAGAVFAAIESRWSHADNDMFWVFFFGFIGTGFSRISFGGGVRFLRSLPLSADQLAVKLLLIPVVSIAAAVAGVAIIQSLNVGHFLNRDSGAFLIPMLGATCFACSFMVRYPDQQTGYILATVLIMMTAAGMSSGILGYAKWPAVFWWLLGLCLMGAAFFLHRRWLRCGESYRVSAANARR